MQGEQRQRLVSLAARAAVENDSKKFHDLLLQLDQLLSETAKVHPIPGNGKNPLQPAQPLNK